MINKTFFILHTVFLSILFSTGYSQSKITLDSCFKLSESNYPLLKKRNILIEQNKLQIEAIKKNLLPKVIFNAQATYQSDVTHVEVPIPNFIVSSPNKGQYKTYLNINQVIYDGGIINGSINLQEVQRQIQQQAIAVTFHQVKSSVNNLFFTYLLLQENEKLLEDLYESLNQKSKELQVGVNNEVVLKSNLDLVEIEKLKIEQKIADVKHDKATLLHLLSQFTGITFDNTVELITPSLKEGSESFNRPELELFNLQLKQIDASTLLKDVSKRPQLAAFIQGGFGNPALNMLDNTLQGYYIGGLKLSWNIYDWNKTNKEKEVLQVQKKLISTDKELFLFQIELEKKKLVQEIEKLKETIERDKKLIDLQKSIVASYESQLKNEVITYAVYFSEYTSLKQSEITLKTHEIKLVESYAKLNLLNGN